MYRAFLHAQPTPEGLDSTELKFIPGKDVLETSATLTEANHIITCALVGGYVMTTVRLFNNVLLTNGFVAAVPEMQKPPLFRTMIVGANKKEIRESEEPLFGDLVFDDQPV